MGSNVQTGIPEYFQNAQVLASLSLERCIMVLKGDIKRTATLYPHLSEEELLTNYKSDALVYFTVINSWTCLTSDVLGERAARALSALISNNGLVNTIEEAQRIAEAVRPNADAWEVDGPISLSDTGLWGLVLESDIPDVVQLLQVLCYPKRMSCHYRDVVLEDESLDKFLAINARHYEWVSSRHTEQFVTQQHRKASSACFNAGVHAARCGRYERARKCFYISKHIVSAVGKPALSDFWLGEIRDAAMQLYHGTGRTIFFDDIPRRILDPYVLPWGQDLDGYFSSGTFADARNGLEKRLNYMSYFSTYKGYALYPFGIKPRTRKGESRILSVPKSYKARRIIAEEQTYSAYWGQAVNKYIQRRISVNHGMGYRQRYNPSDQERNRLLASLGSANGAYSTIDMSGASDSISHEFARLILPPDVFMLIESARSPWLRVRNKRLKSRILLTSGTGLTFDTESDIFLCIAAAVEKVFYRWTGQKVRRTVTIGDDLVVDSRIFDLLCEVLSNCGFVVNIDKSFGSTTRYRESCGIEAYGGYHFQLLYYPRSGIDFSDTDNAVIKLTELQHACYFDYPTMASFFRGLVLDMCPRMTYSTPGSECDDLWGQESYNPVVFPPHDVQGKTCTTQEGIPEHLIPLLARKAHVVLVTQPDNAAYNKALKAANLSEVDLANLEIMRYVDELKRLSLREIVADDGEYVMVEPDRTTPSRAAAHGFVRSRLELR